MEEIFVLIIDIICIYKRYGLGIIPSLFLWFVLKFARERIHLNAFSYISYVLIIHNYNLFNVLLCECKNLLNSDLKIRLKIFFHLLLPWLKQVDIKTNIFALKNLNIQKPFIELPLVDNNLFLIDICVFLTGSKLLKASFFLQF